jgi:outer membrane receptor for ferrienterochelin and colicin
LSITSLRLDYFLIKGGLFLNFFRALLLIFGILNSLLVSAQTGTPQEIVVTANRRAQTVDDSLASVSVITREEIENSNASSLYEVLRGIPGIEVVNSGGMGKTTSVFMRGSESDHVLVLVDGVKMGSATLGTIPFQYLPLSQIERIEIVPDLVLVYMAQRRLVVLFKFLPVEAKVRTAVECQRRRGQ